MTSAASVPGRGAGSGTAERWSGLIAAAVRLTQGSTPIMGAAARQAYRTGAPR